MNNDAGLFSAVLSCFEIAQSEARRTRLDTKMSKNYYYVSKMWAWSGCTQGTCMVLATKLRHAFLGLEQSRNEKTRDLVTMICSLISLWVHLYPARRLSTLWRVLLSLLTHRTPPSWHSPKSLFRYSRSFSYASTLLLPSGVCRVVSSKQVASILSSSQAQSPLMFTKLLEDQVRRVEHQPPDVGHTNATQTSTSTQRTLQCWNHNALLAQSKPIDLAIGHLSSTTTIAMKALRKYPTAKCLYTISQEDPIHRSTRPFHSRTDFRCSLVILICACSTIRR